MGDVQNEDHLFFRVDGIKDAIVTDSIPKNSTKLAFQPFDIRPQERIIPQQGVDIILDSGIIAGIHSRRYLFLKGQRLSNLELTRRFDIGLP